MREREKRERGEEGDEGGGVKEIKRKRNRV